MKTTRSRPPIILSGRWSFRLQSVFRLYSSMIYVSARRLVRGPRLPGWSWILEASMHFFKAQSSAAFDQPTLAGVREYEDALVFVSPAIAQVRITPVTGPIRGDWYWPLDAVHPVAILYLHGGGFTLYSKAHQNLIALVTLAAQSRTFALDYRLSPEHPFPAQLEDALAAYRWLLEGGTPANRLVVAGDSAGGNLTLALLLAARDAALPLPALAVCLCPWTDMSNPGASMTANEPYDLVDKRMCDRWAGWYCQNTPVDDPLVSPIHADLSGLPPIYIQAGGAEALHDMIRAFADCAVKQRAQVQLEVWPQMTHEFQAYGDLLPESQQDLRRIGEVVEVYVA